MVKRSKTKQLNSGKSKIMKKSYSNDNKGDNDDDDDMLMQDGGAADAAAAAAGSSKKPVKYFDKGSDNEGQGEVEKFLRDYIKNTSKFAGSIPLPKFEADDFKDENIDKRFGKIIKNVLQNFTLVWENSIIQTNNLDFTKDESIKSIIRAINKTQNDNKVIVFEYDLYLYNINETILQNIQKVIDSDINKEEFETIYTIYDEVFSQILKVFNNLYTSFNVNDNLMHIYVPKFTKESVKHAIQSGGSGEIKEVLRKNNTDINNHISKIQDFDEVEAEDAPKFWQTVVNKNEKMYGFDTDKMKGDPFTIGSPQVQSYFYKCNDLQILYIKKHIELYDLFVHMQYIIELNIEINQIIILLLDPQRNLTDDEAELEVTLGKDFGQSFKTLIQIQKTMAETSKKFASISGYKANDIKNSDSNFINNSDNSNNSNNSNRDYNFDSSDDPNKEAYFVKGVEKFEILKHIELVQIANMESLQNIFFTEDGENNLHTIITKYKETISNETKGKEQTYRNLIPYENHWDSFKTSELINANHNKMFNTNLINGDEKSLEIQNIVQLAIYKCYDLQILYLVKHLELISIFKTTFYYFDMLIKKVFLLLFILRLYEKGKKGIEAHFPKVQEILRKVKDMVIVQSKVVQDKVVPKPISGGSQKGGSGNSSKHAVDAQKALDAIGAQKNSIIVDKKYGLDRVATLSEHDFNTGKILGDEFHNIFNEDYIKKIDIGSSKKKKEILEELQNIRKFREQVNSTTCKSQTVCTKEENIKYIELAKYLSELNGKFFNKYEYKYIVTDIIELLKPIKNNREYYLYMSQLYDIAMKNLLEIIITDKKEKESEQLAKFMTEAKTFLVARGINNFDFSNTIVKITEKAEEEAARKQQEEAARQAAAAEAAARLAAAEATRLAKTEADRLKKKEAARLKKEEADRLAAEEAARIAALNAKLTEAKAKFTTKYTEIINSDYNGIVLAGAAGGALSDAEKVSLKEFFYVNSKLQTYTNTDADVTIINEMTTKMSTFIDTINRNKPLTLGIVKTNQNYTQTLRNIVDLVKSYDNFSSAKKTSTDEVIKNDNVDVAMNDFKAKVKELEKIIWNDKQLQDSANNNFLNDNALITPEIKTKLDANFDELKLYYESDNGKNLASPLNFAKLFEIIRGAARTIVRTKPHSKDNTAPKVNPGEKPKYTIAKYIEHLKTRQPVQAGGYNYEDLFKIDASNSITFGQMCNTNEYKKPGYGPFSAVYPPQYNNFDIYINMFGCKNIKDLRAEQVDTESCIPVVNDKLNNIVTNVDSRSFSKVNNIPQNLMKKIANDGSVVIFGYGFSGSGKTYVLVEGNKPSDETYDPSMLELFIKENSDQIDSVEIVEIYPKGDNLVGGAENKIICAEDNRDTMRLITGGGTGLPIFEQISENTYNTYITELDEDIIKFNGNTNYNTLMLTLQNKMLDPYEKINIADIDPNNIYPIISNRIKILERHRINKLRILATPNNDKSSRSFLQITLNIKPKIPSKKPKLVFFDMPGTENTIRIKTEFLGTELFGKIDNQGDNPDGGITISERNIAAANIKVNKKKNMLKYIPILNLDSTNKNAYIEAFSNSILNINDFQYCCINMTYKSIAPIGFEIISFLNGIDTENITDLKNEKNIFFLNHKIFEEIYNKFINILNTKDKDNISKYYSFESNKYCKLKYNCKIEKDISSNDNEYIKDIFGVKNIWKSDDSTTSGFIGNLNRYKNLYNFNNLDFKFITGKIKYSNLYGNISLPTELIKTGDKEIIYFANPLIKYIYIILNYILNSINNIKFEKDNGGQTPTFTKLQTFHRASVFFIYKYIKFICEQGRAIITTLEHLKFFFLSRTNELTTYNETTEQKYQNSSFLCTNKTNCDILLNKDKIYTKPITINYNSDSGMKTKIMYERVNIGQMTRFKLLNILQNLAEYKKVSAVDDNNDIIKLGDGKFTLNLSIPISAESSAISAIFVMFTNIKIFLGDADDNKPIENVNSNNKDKLCVAQFDTLEFAESISSATKSKPKNINSVLGKGLIGNYIANLLQSVASGGTRKFNLKELLKPANKKPKTHRNISFKNKKHKGKSIFEKRTKKNI